MGESVMAKLLIEVDVGDPDFRNYDLDLFLIVSVLKSINEERLDWQWSATLTDDNGEIIRESE